MLTKVVIAAATCDRPLMFQALLDSFCALKFPAGVDVHFLFVENGPELTISDRVSDFMQKTGFQAIARHEPRKGVAHARNHALFWALDSGADHLAFVDDDEMVEPDWLEKLLERHESGPFDLTGGPVYPIEPVTGLAGLTKMQKHVLQAMRREFKDAFAARTQRQHDGLEDDLIIPTNNWLCRLAIVRENGIRFDTKSRLGGQEDAAFYYDLKEVGARTGWCGEAVISERVPAERLTLGFQYRRVRDFRHNHLHVVAPRTGEKHGKLRLIIWSLGQGLNGLKRLLLLPIRGRRGVQRVVYSFAQMSGTLAYVAGRECDHYRVMTGE